MKAVLIGVKLDDIDIHDFDDEMEELKNLAYACDIECIDIIRQNLDKVNPQTYVGSGKIKEIKMILESLEADVIICNDELTPLQISNLSNEIDSLIYDRTYLILEIFKKRAQTKEAKIQVEIASLNYMLPRLVGLRKGLSRQRGAGGGLAHGKGAGESKLELDRRINKDRISALKTELKELTKIRKVQRQRRNNSNIATVCLVGYTNSGKSTLMNRLLLKCNKSSNKTVLEKDMLFATLETSSRKIEYEKGSFILTDTVGFIQKLPHNLVEAFKSTLEEIKECDLIIHVIDGSNSKNESQIKATNQVLVEIGVKDIPIIYAFNKIDKVNDYLYIPNEYSNAIRISALEDINIDRLLNMILDDVYPEYVQVMFEIPYGNEKVLFDIKNNSINVEIEYLESKMIIKCKTSEYISRKYKLYVKSS